MPWSQHVTALQKFKVKASQQLLGADLAKLLEEYPEKETAEGSLTIELDKHMVTLHKVVQECKGMTFTDEVISGLGRAVFWHFRHLYLRMRDTLFLSWQLFGLL